LVTDIPYETALFPGKTIDVYMKDRGQDWLKRWYYVAGIILGFRMAVFSFLF
jgi:hypothetical protein